MPRPARRLAGQRTVELRHACWADIEKAGRPLAAHLTRRIRTRWLGLVQGKKLRTKPTPLLQCDRRTAVPGTQRSHLLLAPLLLAFFTVFTMGVHTKGGGHGPDALCAMMYVVFNGPGCCRSSAKPSQAPPTGGTDEPAQMKRPGKSSRALDKQQERSVGEWGLAASIP